ncbi:hypothetical protein PRZ48_015085 [Zasmidium cellare]|uniref:Uncharacterized protein n=1 Tax=Zasmidium cellare TaxID=395010 RepID=A0ABR0DY27_ZASCE|nr:hypothetical protein PRZ48_015085 [Zasmidium cellare]
MNAPPNPGNAQSSRWIEGDASNLYWLSHGCLNTKEYKQLKSEAIERGHNLATMLDAPPSSSLAPQSKFNDVEDLAKFGWSLVLDGSDDKDMQKHLGLFTEAFKKLKINNDPKRWHRIQLVHDIETSYTPTNGTYDVLVNYEQGTIISVEMTSPAEKNRIASGGDPKLKIPHDKLVPLRDWSDVLFLGFRLAAVKLGLKSHVISGGIQHFFTGGFVDKDEKKLCLLIAEDSDDPWRFAPDWPGRVFPVVDDTSVQALASLGTQHGVAVANLFGCHKLQFRPRVIDRASIFCVQEKSGGTQQPQQKLPGETDEEHRDRTSKWCIYFHMREGVLGKFPPKDK